MQITNIQDSGNDLLFIEGIQDGQNYTARGWVSATTNYYGPECYGADGNRLEGSQPRAMTDTEKQAYCLRVLLAQNHLS